MLLALLRTFVVFLRPSVHAKLSPPAYSKNQAF